MSSSGFMLETAMPTVRTVMSLMSCDHTVGNPPLSWVAAATPATAAVPLSTERRLTPVLLLSLLVLRMLSSLACVPRMLAPSPAWAMHLGRCSATAAGGRQRRNMSSKFSPIRFWAPVARSIRRTSSLAQVTVTSSPTLVGLAKYSRSSITATKSRFCSRVMVSFTQLP